MAKYQIQTDNGTFEVETDEAPPAPKPPLPWYMPGAGRDPNKPAGDMFPPGTQIQGAPVLPAGGAINAATGAVTGTGPLANALSSAVGYGVSKIGEKAGLPDWANATAGVLAGLLAHGGTSVLQKAADLSADKKAKLVDAAIDAVPVMGKKVNVIRGLLAPSAPVAPEPFRPNPAIAAKMPYGGPAPIEADATSYGGVGMSGAPESPEAASPAAPFKPNPRIARRLGKGRSAEDYNTPAYGPAVRQTGTPALQQPGLLMPLPEGSTRPAPYTGPNRVNPNIAKKLTFTPGAEDQYAASAGDQSNATLGTRAEFMRQQRLKAKGLLDAGDTAKRGLLQ